MTALKRPSVVRALAEPIRATGEYVTYMGLLPFRRFLPPGDGHPVLVLPGFMASDASTVPLRRLLASLGYEVHGWGFGINVGPTEKVVDEMPRLLRRISEEAAAKVSLVGWSLGGVYARHLARTTTDVVRVVVTLGTPTKPEVHSSSNAAPMYRALSVVHVDGVPRLNDAPLPVPVTALHSRSDGIVDWRACLIQESPTTENLRVRGSHMGMGHNPAAAYVVADRLAQPEGAWKPFTAPAPYRRIVTRVSA